MLPDTVVALSLAVRSKNRYHHPRTLPCPSRKADPVPRLPLVLFVRSFQMYSCLVVVAT